MLNSVFHSEICDWSQSFYTSKRSNQTPGCDNQLFEINNRAINAMREIGRGHTALKTFFGLMNMPRPMQITNENLRYTSYIGDRDTNSYSEVVKKDPYPGTVVQKLECVGHIQKKSRWSFTKINII